MLALALTACVPPSGPAEPNHLDLTRSPILNGNDINRQQALLILDTLGIAPTPTDGFTDAGFAVDLDRPAQEAGWDLSLLGVENCTVQEAALVRDGYSLDVDADTCDVEAGQWLDPLSGVTVGLDSVTPQGFLPPERVWTAGGSAWTNVQLLVYRDSPVSIITLTPASYADRGERGPDQWRPADDRLWCGYALRWVSEKNTFGLALESQAEADALLEMVDTCPEEGVARSVA